MFAALVGILLGVAVASGPLAMYKGNMSLFSDDIVAAVAAAGRDLIQKLPYAGENPKLVTVLSVVLAVTAPGFVAVCLAALANAAVGVKRAGSAVLLALAGASFLVLPASQAVLLLVLAVVVTVLVISPAVFAARAALWGLATLIAFDHFAQLWYGTDPSIQQGTATLVALTQFSTAEFWRFGLIIVGVAPFVCAAGAVLRD